MPLQFLVMPIHCLLLFLHFCLLLHSQDVLDWRVMILKVLTSNNGRSEQHGAGPLAGDTQGRWGPVPSATERWSRVGTEARWISSCAALGWGRSSWSARRWLGSSHHSTRSGICKKYETLKHSDRKNQWTQTQLRLNLTMLRLCKWYFQACLGRHFIALEHSPSGLL